PIISIGKVPISVKRQTQWVLSQASDHYTLQLLAGYNLSTIKNFLAEYPLDRDNLAYYRSYNNGKEWHSLVYGIFPDRDSARQAIKKLPAALAVAKPWVRKLHYIKRDINDTL
ncbi:MAG: SPOR domain-containing protein, partial [Thiohalomonadales bacterium]